MKVSEQIRASLRQATVAKTILDQMGGLNRIRAMTGAKNFIDHGKGVSFQFPNRIKSKANYVKITLDPNDTYTVEFGRQSSSFEQGDLGYKKLRVVHTVYADSLKELFEHETGLHLSL